MASIFDAIRVCLLSYRKVVGPHSSQDIACA